MLTFLWVVLAIFELIAYPFKVVFGMLANLTFALLTLIAPYTEQIAYFGITLSVMMTVAIILCAIYVFTVVFCVIGVPLYLSLLFTISPVVFYLGFFIGMSTKKIVQ